MLARIKEFNGGRYGKTGEYIAEIKPEYFKNGNIKRSVFTVLDIKETIKKGYGYGNASKAWQIVSIIEDGKESFLR